MIAGDREGQTTYRVRCQKCVDQPPIQREFHLRGRETRRNLPFITWLRCEPVREKHRRDAVQFMTTFLADHVDRRVELQRRAGLRITPRVPGVLVCRDWMAPNLIAGCGTFRTDSAYIRLRLRAIDSFEASFVRRFKSLRQTGNMMPFDAANSRSPDLADIKLTLLADIKLGDLEAVVASQRTGRKAHPC